MKKVDQISLKEKELKNSFFVNNKSVFLLNLLLRLINGLFYIYISYVLMDIIDSAVAGDRQKMLYTIANCCIAILVNIGIGSIMRYTYSSFLRKGVSNYRKKVFSDFLCNDLQNINSSNYTKLLSLLTNDVITMESKYYEYIFLEISSFVLCAITLVLMIFKSPILTLIAIVSVFLPLCISLITGDKLAAKNKQISDKNEAFTQVIKDLLGGFSLIKTFSIESHALSQFLVCNDSLEKEKYEKRKLERLIDLLDETAQDVAQLSVFIAGGLLVLFHHGETIGMITMFLNLMNFIISPVRDVPPILAAKKTTAALIKKVALFLSEKNVEQRNDEWDEISGNRIVLKDVSFSYDNNESIFENFNLTFESGKSYAIVGPSGSGKSTLLQLLMRTLSSDKGTIFYGKNAIDEISNSSFYSKVSLVQQNVFIFNDSIKNNITLFRDVSDEKMHTVLEASGLSSLIDKVGLDFQCGEDGCNLSGGEKQRITIARTLLSPSEVLLLDEITSSLDKEVSFHIISSIQKMKGITRISVTHQLDETFLSGYDEIIVLKKGKVVERGPFDSLLKNKGYFYSLFTLNS